MKSESIHHLLTDPDFLRLRAKQSESTLFRILGVTFIERWHSAFLTWLLSPNSGHGLADFPVKRFLSATWDCSHEGDGGGGIDLSLGAIEKLNLTAITFESEFTDGGRLRSPVKGGVARIDTHGYDPTAKIRVVVEQKVKSSEHDDQTATYFEYFNQPDVRAVTEATAYVYLTPRQGDAPKDPNFVMMTFQNFADYVLIPCINHPGVTPEGRYLISQYAENLRSPDAAGNVMAVPDRKTCLELYARHEGLLDAIFAHVVAAHRPIAGTPAAEALPHTGSTTLSGLLANHVLRSTDVMTANHKGRQYQATLGVQTGIGEPPIVVAGVGEFASLSAAARAVTGTNVNGWNFWQVDDTSGGGQRAIGAFRDRVVERVEAPPTNRAPDDAREMELANQLYAAHRAVLDEIFLAKREMCPAPPPGRRPASRQGTMTLGRLLDSKLLGVSDRLEAVYKGNLVRARLGRNPADSEPLIVLDGVGSFQSVSQAASAVTGGSVNGWAFWTVVGEDGSRKGQLNDLRAKAESSLTERQQTPA